MQVKLEQVITDVLTALISVFVFIGLTGPSEILLDILSNIPSLIGAALVIAAFGAWALDFFTKAEEEAAGMIIAKSLKVKSLVHVEKVPQAIAEAELKNMIRTILMSILTIGGYIGLSSFLPFFQELMVQFDPLWAAASTIVTYGIYLYRRITVGSTAVNQGLGKVLRLEFDGIKTKSTYKYSGLVEYATKKVS